MKIHMVMQGPRIHHQIGLHSPLLRTLHLTERQSIEDVAEGVYESVLEIGYIIVAHFSSGQNSTPDPNFLCGGGEM